MARATISRNTIFGWCVREVCFELIHGIISQCLVSIRSSFTLSLKLQTFINSEFFGQGNERELLSNLTNARIMQSTPHFLSSFFFFWFLVLIFECEINYCSKSSHVLHKSKFQSWWCTFMKRNVQIIFARIRNQTERSFIFIIWVLKIDRIRSG